MSYTLKLDWSALRIGVVYEALGDTRLRLKPRDAQTLREDLKPWLDLDVDDSATLKFDWPPELIDALVRALDTYVRLSGADVKRARDNLPGPSLESVVQTRTQIWAAAREIRDYRASVAAAIAYTEERDRIEGRDSGER